MTTLAQLKQGNTPATREAINVGLQTDLGFESMQRISTILSSSTIVPVAYRAKIEKLGRYGQVESTRDNPAAMPNCFVALNMSQRMKADVLMIMQNLHMIEGKPSWSSVFVIASINACGKFSPLRYEIAELEEKTVEYVIHAWVNKEKIETPMSIKIKNMRCIAWAIEKATGERLESPPVTVEIAVKEGWYTKKGSKWPNMPEVMLRYRAATFFGRLYSPELLMGLQTTEEVEDVTFDLSSDSNGAYTMSSDDIRKPEPQPEPQAEPQTEAQAPVDEKPVKPKAGSNGKKSTATKAEPSTIKAEAETTETPASQTILCPAESVIVEASECESCKYRKSCVAYTLDCPEKGKVIDVEQCPTCSGFDGCIFLKEWKEG